MKEKGRSRYRLARDEFGEPREDRFPQAGQETDETGQEDEHREERQQEVVGEFGCASEDVVFIRLAPRSRGQFLECQVSQKLIVHLDEASSRGVSSRNPSTESGRKPTPRCRCEAGLHHLCEFARRILRRHVIDTDTLAEDQVAAEVSCGH